MDKIHETYRDVLENMPLPVFKRLGRESHVFQLVSSPQSELEGGMLSGGDFLNLGIRPVYDGLRK